MLASRCTPRVRVLKSALYAMVTEQLCMQYLSHLNFAGIQKWNSAMIRWNVIHCSFLLCLVPYVFGMLEDCSCKVTTHTLKNNQIISMPINDVCYTVCARYYLLSYWFQYAQLQCTWPTLLSSCHHTNEPESFSVVINWLRYTRLVLIYTSLKFSMAAPQSI